MGSFKTSKQFIFIGNRIPVLEKMFKNGCMIKKIYAVPDSFLSHELDERNMEYIRLPEKKELILQLQNEEYDILVSNGCPYILPISMLDNGERLFVNIHPSLLPDLKGKHPINGALFFSRKHGVTCHFMDDGIDTGDIIEQIEIPTDDLNLDLLYKVSFLMEGEVFERALFNNFMKTHTCPIELEPVYYSRSDEDYYIKESDDYNTIVRRVRAFNSKGQYAKIKYKDSYIRLTECKTIDNVAVRTLYRDRPDYSVIEKFGDGFFLFKFKESILQFRTLDIKKININDILIKQGCE